MSNYQSYFDAQRTTDFIFQLLGNSLIQEQVNQAIYSFGTIREMAAVNRHEQIIAAMLKQLPIALTITKREDSCYMWQWLKAGGEADSFLEALENALVHIEVVYTESKATTEKDIKQLT